ncbi:unnamed protein product [Diplocarpon coronariae]|uniref:Uncharacterized protein n=1 Tax=Diplocarpon coronariae TaxID=2795749 RepID=A0A218YRX1_9HELO|nr:hypothetical protein B2J93_6782 [Marssonina coronariae]
MVKQNSVPAARYYDTRVYIGFPENGLASPIPWRILLAKAETSDGIIIWDLIDTVEVAPGGSPKVVRRSHAQSPVPPLEDIFWGWVDTNWGTSENFDRSGKGLGITITETAEILLQEGYHAHQEVFTEAMYLETWPHWLLHLQGKNIWQIEGFIRMYSDPNYKRFRNPEVTINEGVTFHRGRLYRPQYEIAGASVLPDNSRNYNGEVPG